MSRKLSIYLGDGALAVIEAVRSSVSGRINTVLDRYGAICAREAPTLSLGEWSAICDANNGTIMDDMPSTCALLWANVADECGLSEKWHIDAAALVGKMRAMTFAQSVAVAEVVQQFWSDTKHGLDNETWLRNCGAKFTTPKEQPCLAQNAVAS